jgi:copper(I)-binding protein
MMNLYRVFCFCMLALAVGSVQADDSIKVSNAWVRATAPGQDVGAAYMTLQSALDTSLVKVESPVAGSVEIHSMSMKNGVMKMRMLDTLPLYAGKLAKLEPVGFHLMQFDLKKPLKAGDKLEFTLHFKDSAGKASTVNVSLPVKTPAD